MEFTSIQNMQNIAFLESSQIVAISKIERSSLSQMKGAFVALCIELVIRTLTSSVAAAAASTSVAEER